MMSMRILAILTSLVLISCKPAESPVVMGNLSIQGMHCEKCAKSIHQSVIVIDGVQGCEVSFEDGGAKITADSPATIDNAAERIRLMGFTVDQRSNL